nr:hypothetical protein [Tanacetum cinerariifolium]
MSERGFSPQPVTQYNPITGEVRKEIEKSAVDDNLKVSKVSGESNMSAVVAPVIDNVPVVENVVEKHNPKVTSKVSDESVKESVKVPVVKKSVKASSVVTDKLSSENQKKIDLVADKRSSVVADKVDVVVKKSVKVSSVVADKVDVVVKKSVKVSSVVADKFDVVKDKVDVVADKVSDALKNKLTGKGKKHVVGKDKDKPKNIAPDVVKEKFNPNRKQKVISSEIPVLRLLKQEENPEVKAKKDVSDSELDTDVVDSSDEVDQKRKKLKIKAGLKRKRSGSDSSDSSKIDTKSIKLLIKESDEDSILKKEKKKEKQLTPKEAAHEEYLSSFPSFHARTTPSSLFSAIKNSRVDILRFLTDIGFSDKIKVTPSKIHDMLELKKVRVNDIARKLIATQEIDFLFKVNFLTLFTNTMGKADGLKGQICLDVVRRLREYSVISDIDWCGYIYDYLRDSKLPGGTNHYLDPLTFLIDLIKKAEEKFSLIFAERVILEDYMRKTSLKCPSDGKFVALHEKYVNLFKDPISFEDDGNGDNVGDENGDDDENRDDDGGNVNNDVNDCDVNRDSEDVNEGDKDPNGSNPTFGFSKTSLEDFGNDSGLAEKDKAVEGNPTEQRTVVEGNEAEEGEIMSTPENFTQWLEKNVDLVGEGDLFGDNSTTLEAMNQEITPKKLPTQKESPSP